MNAIKLVGRVAAAHLRSSLERLEVTDAAEGSIARYYLHKLTSQQVASIATETLADPTLAAAVTFRIPAALVSGLPVPPAAITDENAAHARNAPCATQILVLANTVDDLGDTLREITRLGAPELKATPKFWVDAVAPKLSLPASHLEHWSAALAGLLRVEDVGLDQFAAYVDATRRRIEEDGQPLVDALGWALPFLDMPRDSKIFLRLKKDLTSSTKWSKLYQQVTSDRRPLLRKQFASRGDIDKEVLVQQFEKAREEIDPGHHATVEQFIAAPIGWNSAAEALAKLEWEKDNVNLLFSGLRRESSKNLGEETIQHFNIHDPDALSPQDKEYLEILRTRKNPKDARADDRDFFEDHRTHLAVDRALRARWDRFIYGKGVEDDDFVVGLLLAVQKLYDQADNFHGPKELRIATQKKKPKEWFDLNADVLRVFSTRYRGLPNLTKDCITWDTSFLFEYEQLVALSKQSKKKYKFAESTARTSIQIKFELELKIGKGGNAKSLSTQLVWVGKPNAIGIELPSDLKRVAEHPFGAHQVQERAVSKKGTLQVVSLDDASTLEPAFGRDAGSLVSKTDKAHDLAKQWETSLAKARSQGRLTDEGHAQLGAAWAKFRAAYVAGLEAWIAKGIGAEEIHDQAKAYGALLTTLRAHARGDLNRTDLWRPILSLGVVDIVGGDARAIIAPWHPLRLVGAHARMRSLSGLLKHILSADSVNFGDDRLFFSDLVSELGHSYYPEVVVGQKNDAPVLLVTTETVSDYSLAEVPIRGEDGNATSENPTVAAKHIRALVERFLELQPHEQANLSLALYNCDSTALPIATVANISAFQEDHEVRCNVTLRHHNRVKLGSLYAQLLQSVDADPDAIVASENSRDFMAKLRIGIMLDPKEGAGTNPIAKPIDIAFLQDVVSRRAKIEWLLAPPTTDTTTLLEHVPPRWSYKRSSAEDELKSTAYLVCPRQPDEGWAYLDAVYGAVAHKDLEAGEHRIPVRQIVFQDANTQALFNEVHELAEWVVNFDDLLDKRQLLSQNVKVIRYQRQKHHGRNLIVSSTSPLRILEVLVRRRLDELNLDMSVTEIDDLAHRLIADASAISGDIVLRAAKRGVAAGELIGVVLSKALAHEELGSPDAVGWYFLDDYAMWLNQREGRLADVLGLNPTEHNGKPVLRVVVTEAKYVAAEGTADAKRESAHQVEETMSRLGDALFGDPGRLDRDLWLARLSDLLLDAANVGPGTAKAFDNVRDLVRAGAIEIDLRGYSHVFVSGPEAAPVAGEQNPIPKVKNAYQEVFGRAELRKLLKAYAARAPLTTIREALGELRPWEKVAPLLPAGSVNWVDKAPLPVVLASSTKVAASARPTAAKKVPPVTTPPIVAASVNPQPALPGIVGGGATIPSEPPPVPTTTSLYGSRFQAVLDSCAVEAAPETNEWLDATQFALKTALLGYHLGAQVIGSRLTPNAALIRLQGSDKLSVEQLEKRRSELLTTHALNIVSISARPGEIVVAVARKNRETVHLANVLKRRKVNREKSGLNRSFVVGVRELDGELLYLNLGTEFEDLQGHGPHTLIAGTTGSGKSVLVQNLILDMCATNPPSLAHLYIIDPKQGVDFMPLKDLPHLQQGIIVDQDQATKTLAALVAEMDKRYTLFAAKGVKDLHKYNVAVAETERLPAIWVVHDEFAEWMLVEEYKEAVTEYVSRLGTKARAAGIYLIFAAQRPDNNVFPMQLRDNLGNRLVLRVESFGTSEIALKQRGAELLLGKGHLAAALSGEPSVIYAQVPYMAEEDLAEAATAIAEDWVESKAKKTN